MADTKRCYSANKLQFFAHEEGRVRPVENQARNRDFVYDYFIKDHLGNVRMVLTEEEKKSDYLATMETALNDFETKLFDKIPDTRGDKPPGFDNLASNEKVSKLFGNSSGDSRIGPGVLLKVMAGDRFTAKVTGWYQPGATDHTTDQGLSSIFSSLVTALSGSIAGLGKNSPAEIESSGVLNLPLQSFLQNQLPPGSNVPKAFLNYILLSEAQLKYVDGNAEPIPEITGVMEKQLLQINNGNQVNITGNGYVYVFVSNESKGNVYFDDLMIEHFKGPLVEETHYYPSGLTMAGISSKAANTLENKRKWNKGSELESKEFSDGSGLELYSTFYRSLDPQLGRFWQIDPKPDYTQSFYSSMGNNPILYNDPLGDTTIVNRRGYITKQYGSDNLVFLQKGKKLIGIGELGGTIDASKIFKNLLNKNIDYAKGIINPNTFRNLVKNKGEWDLKNNMKTIYGVANHFKGGETQFKFEGKSYTAQDLGNYHYGATGAAVWAFSENFLLQKAGEAQIAAGTSKPEWQRYRTWTENITIEHGMRSTITHREALPPYGDDPRDQDAIKQGFKYYNANKNNLKEED